MILMRNSKLNAFDAAKKLHKGKCRAYEVKEAARKMKRVSKNGESHLCSCLSRQLRRRHSMSLVRAENEGRDSQSVSSISTSKESKTMPKPTNAATAINRGLIAFTNKDYDKAKFLFEEAIANATNDTEMRAGLYNLACAKAKLGEYDEACQSLLRAVNEYKLKIDVALGDEDLASLRETRQFDELQAELVGGGGSEEMNIKLRNEAKNPFRFARLTILGGLGAGAGIGLLIILSRLIIRLTSPSSNIDLDETIKNLAINSTALFAIGYVLKLDLEKRDKEIERLKKEDDIGRLLVNLGSSRVVPLSRLRQSTRPVLVVGPESYVKEVMKNAEKWKTEFRRRGVVFVPFIRRFGSEISSSKGFATTSTAMKLRQQLKDEGLISGESGDGGGMVAPSEKRWRCEPVGESDWEAWTNAMLIENDMYESTSLYAQIQLDGSVRTSGGGIPPFRQWLDDIPELDDVRTKLTGE